MWDGKGNAEEGVKSVGLAFTTGAGKTRAKLGLEDVDNKTVVATHVVGKAFGGQDIIRPSRQVLQPLVFLLGCSVQLLVYSVRQMSVSCRKNVKLNKIVLACQEAREETPERRVDCRPCTDSRTCPPRT